MSGDDYRLPRRLRGTLANLAPVILTRDVETRGLVPGVVDGVERFLGSVPAHVRGGVTAGLAAFEASAALVPWNLGRGFSRLGPDRAREHFERWYASPVGPVHQLGRALKMFVSFAYYELPEVKRDLGYDPDRWIAEAAARRLERFSEDVEAGEEAVRAPDPLVPAGGRRLPLHGDAAASAAAGPAREGGAHG